MTRSRFSKREVKNIVEALTDAQIQRLLVEVDGALEEAGARARAEALVYVVLNRLPG